MTVIDGSFVRILIHHTDSWRGNYYVSEDMTFTSNVHEAVKCYLLKPGDTSILNGDRISINTGNKTLVVTPENEVKFMDRETITREISTYIITNGTDSVEPIAFDMPIFLIVDNNARTALRYKWSTDLLTSQVTPSDQPNLIVDGYGEVAPAVFELRLKNADTPNITQHAQRPDAQRPDAQRPDASLRQRLLSDEYKKAALLIILLIILIVSIVMSK